MVKNLSIENDEQFAINKNIVHNVVAAVKKELNFSISFLQINFVSSQYIIKLNEQYLKHEGSTDIITFDYSEENNNENNLDGECFICVEVAEENAKKFDVSIDLELIRLVVHGILHLLAYDDIEEDDRKVMKEKENELVQKFENISYEVISGYDK